MLPPLDSPFEDDFQLVPLKRKRRVEDAIPEDEKDSMLRELAQRGASGLSAVGWLLDTPGAVVRGLLSDGPMKGLSALWETSDERVTGRELLRDYGLVSDEDNYGNFGGGLATEILLDPLTYASFGLAPLLGGAAKTAAGRAASRAGLLTDDLGLLAREASKRSKSQIGRNQLLRQSPADLIDLMPANLRDDALRRFREKAGSQADDLLGQSMTASNRVSLPFVGEWGVDFYGKRAGDLLAKGADKIGDTLQYGRFTGPAVRAAQAMFDTKFMGFSDEADRWMARQLTQSTKDAARVADRELSEALVNTARNVGEDTFRSQGFRSALRDVLEGRPLDQLSDEIRPLFEPGGGAEGLIDFAKGETRRAIDAARARGVPLSERKLPNDIEYFLRQRVAPDRPVYPKGAKAKPGRGYGSDARVASVLGERGSRRDYLEAFPARIIDAMARDGDLQAALRKAPDVAESGPTGPSILQKWLADNAEGFEDPFAYLRKGDGFTAGIDSGPGEMRRWTDLADMLRNLPENFAKEQLPFFGDAVNDIQRYVRSRRRSEATADVLLDRILGDDMLIPRAADEVAGDEVYGLEKALEMLGFDTKRPKLKDGSEGVSNAALAVANRLGIAPEELANRSVRKADIDRLNQRILGARNPRELGPLMKAVDDYTNVFKSLALLYPSRYSRDKYSGSFASAMKNAFSPADEVAAYKIGRGDYSWIPGRVRDLPEYQALNTTENLNALRSLPKYENATPEELLDELMIRKFLTDAGAEGVLGTSVVDDLGRQAGNLNMQTNIPGLGGNYTAGLGAKFRPGSWAFWNPFRVRGKSGSDNFLVAAGDAAAQTTDTMNRLGAYLNRIRKGDDPRQAKAIADLTQVDYRPQAFTEFEREYLKRLIPFYSYTKGITPLVADQLVNKPAGLMGQSIRAINRAGEPSEDRFTPEYLRQSASVPLPFFQPDNPELTRFLTNIDLPHEGLLNLFTPGVSNSAVGSVVDSVMKSGQNILGQSNPILKGPLELILNRQFYSGRQLSDLYSMLEQDIGPIGRVIDQIGVNLPGGSRALGLLRQARDSRLNPGERAAKIAFNTLTGMKFQDVDQDRVRRLAARTTLNELLDQATGMSSYENLYIKPEDLVKLPQEEQRQYLLYRALQAEAARKARERKKAEQDPLSVFNL
jgi:hypothetical protein